MKNRATKKSGEFLKNTICQKTNYLEIPISLTPKQKE
jgi:hypothetical protein